MQDVSVLYEDIESMDIAQAFALHDQPNESVRGHRDDGHMTLDNVCAW